jgi:hypothetical protein
VSGLFGLKEVAVRIIVLASLVLVSCVAASSLQEKGQKTTASQRLTAPEEKAIRNALIDSGPSTASRSLEQPYPRILVVPKRIEEIYAKKPRATVDLLLKVVEGGRSWDSIHAVGCIQALVWEAEQGGIFAEGADAKAWDDAISEDRETWREFWRQNCVRLVDEKLKKTADKKEK